MCVAWQFIKFWNKSNIILVAERAEMFQGRNANFFALPAAPGTDDFGTVANPPNASFSFE
jgi:hypothetical protein